MLRTTDQVKDENHNVESSPIVIDGIMVVGTRGQSIFGVKIS